MADGGVLGSREGPRIDSPAPGDPDPTDVLARLQRDLLGGAAAAFVKSTQESSEEALGPARAARSSSRPSTTSTLRGRRRIESKAAIKQRIGRSPDVADALGLAVYHGPHRYEGALPPVTTYQSPAVGL